jgi:hypothetical protein
MRTDVVCDLRDVRVVKGGVDFVEDEERRGLVAAHFAQQRDVKWKAWPHL